MILFELKMKAILLSPLLMLSFVDGAKWQTRFNMYSIGINQDAVMECDITGADFTGFYTNNAKIVANDRIKIVKENEIVTLEISQVREADYGKYICKDSKNGSDTATLEISVSLEQNPESPQILLAGERGEVKVRVYGMPKPKVTWSLTRVNETKKIIASADDKGKMITNVDGLYNIEDDGTLKINKIRAIDAGKYEVKVSRDGARSSKSVSVMVEFKLELKTKPPTEFVRAVGQKLFIPCEWLYAETEFPKWTFKSKDGKISVITEGVKAKGLEIAAVAMKDAGRYICSASNKYGNESVFSDLKQVIDPAKITSNFNTTFKERLESEYSLVCEASGSPTPTVKLFQLKKDKSAFELIAESKANTGKVTKTFSKLGISDGGLYQCHADNNAKTLEGVSMAETKNITLEVFAPTEIDEKLSTKEIVSAIGRNYSITCVAKGYPHPTMTLLGNNGTVLPIKVTTVKDTVTAKLVVTNAQQKNFLHKKITCAAKNAHGSQNRTIAVTQILKAPAPTDLVKFGQIGLSEIDLQWGAVKGADSYIIFVNVTNNTFREIAATSNTKTIDKLSRKTYYGFSVASVNLAGTGKKSDTVVYETADIVRPKAVTKFRVEDLTSLSATVVWDPPSNIDPNIITYKITYCTIVNSTEQDCQDKEKKESKLKLSQLLETTTYRVKVIAINQGKKGKEGELFSFTTRETPPPTEPSLVVPGGLSSGEIAGIIVAIILILLIVVDLFCCFFNNCGFSHCCFETFCASKDKKFLPVDTEANDTQELEEGKAEVCSPELWDPSFGETTLHKL